MDFKAEEIKHKIKFQDLVMYNVQCTYLKEVSNCTLLKIFCKLSSFSLAQQYMFVAKYDKNKIILILHFWFRSQQYSICLFLSEKPCHIEQKSKASARQNKKRLHVKHMLCTVLYFRR